MKKIIIAALVLSLVAVVIGKLALAPALSTSELPPSVNEPEPVETPEIPEPPAPLPVVENANEIGRFPVLMYHRIADQEGSWTRSRENFRRDLEVLYERGYTIVNLSEFLSGRAVVPAGRTPVVLTFDDSTQGQFNYLIDDDKNVQIDPDSAVGMLLEAFHKWPELGLGGNFYLNANPFGQRAYSSAKLQHLVELGFEIGNHTYTHPKLNQLSAEKVQEEQARIQEYVSSAVPGYQLDSLALPFGIAPTNRQLAAEGMWNGVQYKSSYILEVGAEPAYPPGHKKYNPLSIPRIAVTDELFYRWLNWLDADPLRRYISDGDADTFTVPEELKSLVQ